MSTELRDTAERVTSLERLATRVTRYEGRSSDVIVPVENVSGADLEHGSAVVLSGIGGSDGVLEVTKPDKDSDMQFLGVIVGKLLSGAVGKCQIAGVAEARRDATANYGVEPVIGAWIGPQENSHLLAHDQFGARFLCDLHDAGGDVTICLILLQHTDRLVADHRTNPDHLQSTAVYAPFDLGSETYWTNGTLSDVWAVHAAARGKTGYTSLMWDIRVGSAGHSHGWMLGYVIEEGDTGVTEGWGRLATVLGIRYEGQSYVDIKTDAHFNNGQETMPLLFDRNVEPVFGGGDWVIGAMVPHPDGTHWVPSIPVEYALRSVDVPYRYDTFDCGEIVSDRSRLLVDPTRYQKFGTITGPDLISTSADDYLEWIACNRYDINGIFRALWFVSCIFSWRVGQMDSNLLSTLMSGGSLDNWMVALQSWGARVTSLFADPLLTILWGGVTNGANGAYENMVWYTSKRHLGPAGTEGQDLPELTDCPMHENV